MIIPNINFKNYVIHKWLSHKQMLSLYTISLKIMEIKIV